MMFLKVLIASAAVSTVFASGRLTKAAREHTAQMMGLQATRFSAQTAQRNRGDAENTYADFLVAKGQHDKVTELVNGLFEVTAAKQTEIDELAQATANRAEAAGRTIARQTGQIGKLQEQLAKQAVTMRAFFGSLSKNLDRENVDLKKVNKTLERQINQLLTLQKADIEAQRATFERQNDQLQTDVATLTQTNAGLVTDNRELVEFNGQLMAANARTASMMAMMKPKDRFRKKFGKAGLSSAFNAEQERLRLAALKRKAERAGRPAGATGSPRASSRSNSDDDMKVPE